MGFNAVVIQCYGVSMKSCKHIITAGIWVCTSMGWVCDEVM